MVDGHLEYYGVFSVTIRYSKEANKWIALSDKSADFIASSESSGPQLLLGPQSWLVSNDSAGCSGRAGLSYTARLSLSACQGGDSQAAGWATLIGPGP